MTVRQTDDLLREILPHRSLRVKDPIREHIVNGRKPRRIKVANPRHLHGRGLMSEYGQTVVFRVSREIHENIYRVAPHARGRPRGTHPHDIAPVNRLLLHRQRNRILRAARITVHRKLLLIERMQEGIEKICNRMAAQIRRNIANANRIVPACRVRSRCERTNILMDFLIVTQKTPKGAACVLGQVVHRKERIAVLRRFLRPHRLPQTRGDKRAHRLLRLARER